MAGLIFYRTNHGHLGMSCIQFPAPTLFFSWLELRMHQYNDPPPKYYHQGKTVSLMLLLTKNLPVTGNIVVLYSSFCVLQGLVDINKKGIYGAALINKRQ